MQLFSLIFGLIFGGAGFMVLCTGIAMREWFLMFFRMGLFPQIINRSA